MIKFVGYVVLVFGLIALIVYLIITAANAQAQTPNFIGFSYSIMRSGSSLDAIDIITLPIVNSMENQSCVIAGGVIGGDSFNVESWDSTKSIEPLGFPDPLTDIVCFTANTSKTIDRFIIRLRNTNPFSVAVPVQISDLEIYSSNNYTSTVPTSTQFLITNVYIWSNGVFPDPDPNINSGVMCSIVGGGTQANCSTTLQPSSGITYLDVRLLDPNIPTPTPTPTNTPTPTPTPTATPNLQNIGYAYDLSITGGNSQIDLNNYTHNNSFKWFDILDCIAVTQLSGPEPHQFGIEALDFNQSVPPPNLPIGGDIICYVFDPTFESYRFIIEVDNTHPNQDYNLSILMENVEFFTAPSYGDPVIFSDMNVGLVYVWSGGALPPDNPAIAGPEPCLIVAGDAICDLIVISGQTYIDYRLQPPILPTSTPTLTPTPSQTPTSTPTLTPSQTPTTTPTTTPTQPPTTTPEIPIIIDTDIDGQRLIIEGRVSIGEIFVGLNMLSIFFLGTWFLMKDMSHVFTKRFKNNE